MKKWILLLFIFVGLVVYAENYTVMRPDQYKMNKFDNVNEKTLFIVDFSNSMTEYLDGKRKIDLMLDTMAQILPRINPDNSVGLRVYGHRNGLTAFDMCKASTLLVPVAPGSAANIQSQLFRTKARGMTPITFSLKQALKYDFAGFEGKKHIILLTDGGENCDESPCKYAMELVTYRKDVKIDVIAFNIDNKDDLEQLECTSLVTTGKFYTANTASELVNSLNNSLNIKKDVDAKIIFNEY